MSKLMLVTVPPLLLLLDYWPLGRWGDAIDLPRIDSAAARPGFGVLLLEKLPLAALAAGACVMTLLTHATAGAGPPLPFPIGKRGGLDGGLSGRLFLSTRPGRFYPVPDRGYPTSTVAGAVVVLLAVTASVILARRRCPDLAVGWFWFLGMLAAVLGVVQVSRHSMADRYMYLPGIGLSIAVGWSLARFAASSLNRRWAVACCGLLALLARLGQATWQTRFWSDEVTLWQHALDLTADNSEAEVGLADAD